MKIADILNEARLDDLDDEENEIVDDPDSDRIPHLVMQFKKAIDNGGKSPIVFKDGDKVSVPLKLIVDFVSAYMMLKPYEREEFQRDASENREAFVKALHDMRRKTSKIR